MEQKELDEIIENHLKWIGGKGDKRANLCGADLRGVILRESNLRKAILRGIDLRRADLRGARLPTGMYQVIGSGSNNRCTTYDSINDRIICGCWDDNKGNNLESFKQRVESVYGPNGATPHERYYAEYRAAIRFFEAIKK